MTPYETAVLIATNRVVRYLRTPGARRPSNAREWRALVAEVADETMGAETDALLDAVSYKAARWTRFVGAVRRAATNRLN